MQRVEPGAASRASPAPAGPEIRGGAGEGPAARCPRPAAGSWGWSRRDWVATTLGCASLAPSPRPSGGSAPREAQQASAPRPGSRGGEEGPTARGPRRAASSAGIESAPCACCVSPARLSWEARTSFEAFQEKSQVKCWFVVLPGCPVEAPPKSTGYPPKGDKGDTL